MSTESKLSFNKCRDMMEKRGEDAILLDRNTYLYKPNQSYVVRLYSTPIIVFHPDRSVTLAYGKHKTSLTRGRMNRFLPRGFAVASDNRMRGIKGNEGEETKWWLFWTWRDLLYHRAGMDILTKKGGHLKELCVFPFVDEITITKGDIFLRDMASWRK